VQDGDPWNLKEEGMYTAEWDWFDRRLETALADGGEHQGDGEDVATDGGTVDDDASADTDE
jgi:cytochrome c oxidase subunit 1